jgi:hypothetical protein
MRLALGDSSLGAQHGEHHLVRTGIVWRNLQPPFQVGDRILLRGTLDDLFQQGDVPGAELAPLGAEPGAESRTAIHFQSFKEFPLEQREQRLLLGRREQVAAPAHRADDFHRIDPAVAHVDPDRVRGRLDPAAAGLVDEAPDLAEAPAQLATRIVRNIPEQIAERASGNGTRRKCEIGEECADLSRCGHRQERSLPFDRQGTQHPYPKGSARFQRRFHSRYHVRLHVR